MRTPGFVSPPHDTQAIFLAAILMGLVVHLFTKLVGVINSSLAGLLSFANIFILFLILAAYELACLYAMWNILQGREFEYPLVGQKLHNTRE